MSTARKNFMAIGAAAALASGSTIAVAQWQNSPLMKSFSDNWTSSSPSGIGQLASNEGIYVDVKDFKVLKGQAKGDPAAQIAKLGAKKVSDGAIIFRSGDSLYIVDSKPPTTTQ